MKLRRLMIWKLIISGFGLGYSPFAPGTLGAIGALAPAILILKYAHSPYLWLIALILLFTVLGIIGSNKLRDDWGRDPSRTVVDEMVGMWISLMWVGTGWIPLFAAFILFRFFDIAKPLGIRYTERLPGGLGVMTDDILAGIYTNAILQITLMLVPALI
jgi:phosphatidylglycerophosphatase A